MGNKVIDIMASARLFAISLVQIILSQLAVFALLVLSPVLYLTVPFYVVAKYPGANLSTFATAYLIFGPFASAFWMVVVCRYWLAFMAAHQGRLDEFKANNPWIKGMFKCIGWMILGFVGTCVAEFILLGMFGYVHTQADYYKFFTVAPFFVFSPSLLVILARIIRRIGQGNADDHYEALRYAKQYVIDANRHEAKQRVASQDNLWLQDCGIKA